MVREIGLAAALLSALPAQAAWLSCSATGTDAIGEHAYLSTLANVGPVTAARQKQLQAKYLAYLAKADPETQGLQGQCFTSDDQLTANEHYSRTLSDAAGKMGWDKVMVVRPRDWLAESDILDDPSRP